MAVTASVPQSTQLQSCGAQHCIPKEEKGEAREGMDQGIIHDLHRNKSAHAGIM